MNAAEPSATPYIPGHGLHRAGGVVVVISFAGLVLGILAVFNQPWMAAWQDSKVASAPIVNSGDGIALKADTKYSVYTSGGLCDPIPPSGEERYSEAIRASVQPSTDDAGTWEPTVMFVTEEAGTYVFECWSKSGTPVQARVFPSGMFEAVAGLYLSAIGVVAIVVFLIFGGVGGLLMLIGTHQQQRALLYEYARGDATNSSRDNPEPDGTPEAGGSSSTRE